MRRPMRNRLSAVLQRLAEETDARVEGEGLVFAEGRYRLRVANDIESRRKAYGLVYDLYTEREYASPHSSRMWLSLFDALPETTTLLVERTCDATAVGAMTATFDSPMGLPADSLYRDELDALRARDRRLCEFGSLGVLEEERAGGAVLVEMFSYISILSREVRGATDIVITVNPRHEAFYRRMLLFGRIGDERDYGKVGGAPAVLMRLDFDRQRKAIADEHLPREMRPRGRRTLYGRFRPAADEPEMIAALDACVRPMSERELRYFLVEKTNLLARATPAERAHLQECHLVCDLMPETSDTREYQPV